MDIQVNITGLKRAKDLTRPRLWRRAISAAMNIRAKAIAKNVPGELKSHYTHKDALGADKAVITPSTADTLRVTLAYPYTTLPLTKFSHTTFVHRPGAIGMKVQVKQGSEYKLVNGKLGYKGFVQKGTVYERLQKATWKSGVRLPYRPLFGPSVAQMVNSPEMQEYFKAQGTGRGLNLDIERFL